MLGYEEESSYENYYAEFRGDGWKNYIYLKMNIHVKTVPSMCMEMYKNGK